MNRRMRTRLYGGVRGRGRDAPSYSMERTDRRMPLTIKRVLPGRSSERPTQATGAASHNTAAQDWLPLKDLHSGCLVREDGGIVAGIAIAPYNLALKSDRERTAAINGLWAALNGLSVPWQWLSVYRPVDLDRYLATLDDWLAGADARRRAILRDYIRWVSEMVRSGTTVERKYYLLCTRTGPDAIAEHTTALRTLQTDLGRIRGLRATIMDDAAWRELLFLTFHARQAAVEPVPDAMDRIASLVHRPATEEVF